MEARKLANDFFRFLSCFIIFNFFRSCVRIQDNYNRMIQEQKPKKNVRKKIKASAINQLPKRNKKKKKQHQVLPEVPNVQQKQQPPINAPPPITVKQPKFIPVNSVPHLNQMIQKVDNTAPQHIIATMPAITTSNMINAKLLPANHVLTDNITLYQFANSMHGLSNVQQHTDLLSVCENSSAYESSEDTGVGGLSESELIGASDGIGNAYCRNVLGYFCAMF